MKTIYRLTTALLSVSLLFIATPNFAKHGHRGADLGGLREIIRELDIDSEQKQDIKQLARQFRADVRVFRSDLREFKRSLHDLAEAEVIDEEAINQLIADNQAIRQEVGLLRARLKHDVWNLFTEEQQAEASAILNDREPREINEERLLDRLEELEFSDEQLSQAQAILDQAQEDLAPVIENIESFKEAERELITSDTFSDEAWLALFEANSENFQQAQFIRITVVAQIKNLATEEQQELAKELRRSRERRGSGLFAI